jgi:gamma-glutamylcyclotransferase
LTLQPKNTFFYFAYASNLSKQQMRERCPSAIPKFSAVLPNYKRIFTGWSRAWHGAMANLQPYRGSKVQGALYEVTEAAMRQLEKHDVGYTRLNVTVFDEDNQSHPAVTLVKLGLVEEALPSKEYAAVIKQGMRDWAIG